MAPVSINASCKGCSLRVLPRPSTVIKAQDRKSVRVGKECRSRCDWSSDVCSSDLRSAEAALNGASIDKRFLQRMQLACIAQTLHGYQSATARLRGQSYTAWTRHAIDQNRASATLTGFAAMLDAVIALAAQDSHE